jgi:hypothetical protein
MNEQENNNGHNLICIFRKESQCLSCKLNNSLRCKFEKKHLLRFILSFLIFAIPSIVGMILSGYGWFLLGWLGFMLFFFNVWESRILCRHCPFYSEKRKTLHCIANYGSYKLWKYDPKPMSSSEKAQLIIGFLILAGYPLFFIYIGNQYLFLLLSIAGLTIFFGILLLRTCSKCVNFSCPLNRVPRHIIDAYLKKNPIMKEAWEAKGYSMKKN